MRGNTPVSSIVLFILVAALGILAGAKGALAEQIGPWRMEKAGMRAEWKINAQYPVFGNPDVDNHIKAWLTAHAAGIMDQVKDNADADVAEALFDLKIEYSVSATPSGALSVLFTTYSDSNHSAHPSAGLSALNFSPEGKILFLDSLFAKPDLALEIFAQEAPKRIKQYYRDRKEDIEGVDDMIADGTQPARENYSCYTLESDGIRIYFQQYQVVPYYLGMSDILIPLEALESAGPNPGVWPKP